jgi:hydrogenase nickel incorporation protein HypB
MFRNADLVLITKTDLLPHLDVRIEAIADALSHVMPQPRYLPVSARSGEGMERWLEWLVQLHGMSARPSPVETAGI